MNILQFIALGICLILTVQLHAWSDGVRDNGNKEKEKYIQLFRVLTFFIIAYLVPQNFKLVLLSGLTYFGLRTSLFDFVHNYICNKPWYYSGTNSITDREVSKLRKWMIMTYRIVAFIFACLMFYLVVTKCI